MTAVAYIHPGVFLIKSPLQNAMLLQIRIFLSQFSESSVFEFEHILPSVKTVEKVTGEKKIESRLSKKLIKFSHANSIERK